MGCADYRIYCDGDSDGDGNDLMHGVLDKKKRLGVIPRRFGFTTFFGFWGGGMRQLWQTSDWLLQYGPICLYNFG